MIRVGVLMGSRRILGDQSLQTVSHREHSATQLQSCGDFDAAAGALGALWPANEALQCKSDHAKSLKTNERM
jgi:hypothetical protein